MNEAGLHQAPFLMKSGGLAQLARAPALQAGGQRFESVILHTAWRWYQIVNRRFVNRKLPEFFDILTHKTVSKDLYLVRTE